MSYNWSTTSFARIYEAIQIDEPDRQLQLQLINLLKPDLNKLLINPKKNESSRKKLESGKVTFQDGQEYELNQEFILNSAKLSDELDLDELACAETLYYASINEFKTVGTELLDSAKAAYYTRRQYILQITAYYTCASSDKTIIELLIPDSKFISEILLESFKLVESELESIKQLIERSKLLDNYRDPAFLKSISYRRDQLFKEHQLLGEIFYGCCIQSSISVSQFNSILLHFSSFQPSDIFILSYVPGSFRFVSSLNTMPTSDVITLHKQFMTDLSDSDKLSEVPIKTLIILVFLTCFIDWCKHDDSRAKKFEFIASVDEPMRKVISLGALEQFLSLTAETSLVSASIDGRIKPLYDFRLFLQQHIPRMTPARMMDVDEQATSELRRTLQQQSLNSNANIDESRFEKLYLPSKDISLENHFIEFCAPIFNRFVHEFIKASAFVLTYMRDTEEDQLLSSEDFDLDALAENADLERFYLSMFYLYSSRPELATEFWVDKNSSSYGFLKWASRCNSPLIISTFCLVLSALSNTNENAINTFNFLQITDSNNSDNENSSTVTSSSLISRYSCISWSTIYSSLAYYNKALSENSTVSKTNPISAPFQLPKLEEAAVFELGEDSIIFISGFFQLISEVARNSPKARTELFESDDYQLLTILSDFLRNYTPLVGPTLTALSSLVGDSVTDRKRIWQMVDSWIYDQALDSRSSPDHSFSLSLKSYKEVSGFTYLISELLEPVDNLKKNPFNPIETPYPLDLGSRIRKQGIWPYIKFLTTDVFVNSSQSSLPTHAKVSLQLALLEMWEKCLSDLNPNLVLDASACGLKDLDNITKNRNIIQYFQSHPGSAIINFLYEPSVHNVLFDIASLGIDAINELPIGSPKTLIVEKSLKVLDLLAGREKFYIDELLPILRLEDNPFYYPSKIGTSGLGSFFDALLLRLPLVAHISLYVGSTNLILAQTSLSILKKVTILSDSPASHSTSDYYLLNKNRLLTMFKTVDESTRIRYAFIDQFESPIEQPESVAIKVELLQFLNNNLSTSPRYQSRPTVTHFLLGFDSRTMSLGSPSMQGTILSERSLFNSLLIVLKDTLAALNGALNIDYAPVRICSLCLEIILKLSKSEICGSKTLEYLRNGGTNGSDNFFMELLKSAKKISLDTYWSSLIFNEELNCENEFTSSGESMCALIAYIMHRSLILQLIALELHLTSAIGSRSLTKKYVDMLTDSSDFATGSPRILEFLDILEYRPKNMIEKPDQLFSIFNFEYIFKKISLKTLPVSKPQESPYNMSVIDDLVALVGKESQTLGLIQSHENAESTKFFETEVSLLKKILTNSISFDNFKAHHLQYLHSWVMMVQVIVTDGQMSNTDRSGFILEVFQCIIPKINDYLELDISYAQDLISLCVSLYHIYEKDKQALFKNEKECEVNALLDSNRLFPMFKSCIIGIMSPQATPTIRSDLYVLANNYLQQAMFNKTVVTDLMIFIRSAEQKFIHSICTDSLVGDGPCRITALLLLGSLIKVASSLKNSKISGNFIVDMICKNNYLLLLVQKLKATDDLFAVCLEGGKQGITLNTLLYELTAFKTCIYFLIRIAQIRSGAQHLLHSDIFSVIKDCRFLLVDADLGFALSLEEYRTGQEGTEKFIKLNLSLDNPLSLASSTGKRIPMQAESISYYEIFVPVFQLVNTIVISLGPQNETSIKQARELKTHFQRFIAAVLKRDIIVDENYAYLKEPKNVKIVDENNDQKDSSLTYYENDDSFVGLKSLVKLITLLDSLV